MRRGVLPRGARPEHFCRLCAPVWRCCFAGRRRPNTRAPTGASRKERDEIWTRMVDRCAADSYPRLVFDAALLGPTRRGGYGRPPSGGIGVLSFGQGPPPAALPGPPCRFAQPSSPFEMTSYWFRGSVFRSIEGAFANPASTLSPQPLDATERTTTQAQGDLPNVMQRQLGTTAEPSVLEGATKMAGLVHQRAPRSS
jgi:hypothetical protein